MMVVSARILGFDCRVSVPLGVVRLTVRVLWEYVYIVVSENRARHYFRGLRLMH